MAKFIIEGNHKLNGTIAISGNKNSILPCIAASLLTEDEVILRNAPDIEDVKVLLDICKSFGAEVDIQNHVIKIRAKNIKSTTLTTEFSAKLRASILVVGPLLARVGKVEFSHPGGDVIGKRSIDTHLEGLKRLGFSFNVYDRDYIGFRSKVCVGYYEIFLTEASVTATENLILASVIGRAKVKIKNCAKEPHVVDLCNLLILMGAKIEGVGNSSLLITGVYGLHGADFTIGTDYIEIGTYAIAASVTGGEVKMSNCSIVDLEPVTVPLRKMGVRFKRDENGLICAAAKGLLSIQRLLVSPWPGFPTDLMSVFIVLATQAKGDSLMHDWMFESRMFFVDKLISMGANITIADPHRVLVYGPTKLYARDLETPDIRAGMALVLAALIAKGQSTINKAELIERGYEDIVGKLTTLGAKIERRD